MTIYNDKAINSASGQFDIFSGEIRTKEDLLKDIINTLNYGTKQEQQQAIAGAIERRKETTITQKDVVTDAGDTGSGRGAGEKREGRTGKSGIAEPTFTEETLENGDVRITNYNSRGEVEAVTIERDGKIVSVDKYDEGKLFERTEYDGNGKSTQVTRYAKDGSVSRVGESVDRKYKISESLANQEKGVRFSLVDGRAMMTYFSGGGLLEQGTKGADADIAVEYDKKIADVYTSNNQGEMIADDVRNIRMDDIRRRLNGKPMGYFHASPVCTRFSGMNTKGKESQLDLDSARATADVIRNFRPSMVTIENVPSYRNSQSLQIILEALDNNGMIVIVIMFVEQRLMAKTTR